MCYYFCSHKIIHYEHACIATPFFFCAVVKFPSSYCVQWNDIKHCFGKLWWASAKQLISVRSCELVPVRVLGVRGVCCVYSCCSTHSQWRTSHHDLKAGGAPSFLAEMCSCVKIIILLGFFQYKHWLRLLVLGCFGLGVLSPCLLWFEQTMVCLNLWFSVFRLMWKRSVDLRFSQNSWTRTHIFRILAAVQKLIYYI